MNKPSKLSRFEKRVEERHKRQEAEYGRDEFLFGAAEDDEEADVEFDEEYTSEWDVVAVEDETAGWDSADIEDEPSGKPRVGERTEIIAAEIVEAEMASLAAEMSVDGELDGDADATVDDAGTNVTADESYATATVTEFDAEPDAADYASDSEPDEPHEIGSETMNISAAILAETERALAEESVIGGADEDIRGTSSDDRYADDRYDEDSDIDDSYRAYSEMASYEDEEPVDEDEDFDFYSMSETAELEAAAVAEELYHRTDGGRAAKPKVHKERSAGSAKAKAGSSARSAKANARSAAKNAKNAKAKAQYAKSAAKSAKSARAYEKKADAYEKKAKSAGFFSNMSMGDRLIVVTGVCVLITAIVTGVIFANAQTVKKQVASFDTVGASTDGIYVIGESGLNAVVAARAGYSAVQEDVEDVVEEVEEPEEIVIEDKTVTIVMKVSSVQSDLKIKFANKSTDKLISGIPFEVTVTSDSGKEYNWSDENKDGLMYHTEVPNGTYNVSMKPLEGPEYEDYVMPADVKGVKVTDTIAYKKVDVADEVKTEAEVNVAKEDTAVQDTAIESSLKDTVEWVESSKTLVSGSEKGYKAIDKSSIPDPNKSGLVVGYMKQARGVTATSFYRTLAYAGTENTNTTPDTPTDTPADQLGTPATDTPTDPSAGTSTDPSSGSENSGGQSSNTDPPASVEISVSPTSLELEEGKTGSLSATVSGTDNKDVTWDSGNTSVATVSGGTVTAISAGTAVITAKSVADTSKSASCTVTVRAVSTPDPPPVSVTVSSVDVSPKTLSLTVGDTSSLTAAVKMSDNSTTSAVNWTSSDSNVVTVSGGSLSAKKAGTATITATSTADTSKSASCTVTVADKNVANITLNPTSVSIKVGASSKVTATVSGVTDKSVTWASSDANIATVDGNGNIKGVKAGSATVTATLKADTSKKATVSVTVTAAADPKAKLKDSSGRQVYIKTSDGKYVEATVADYESAVGFYIEGGDGDAVYKYTGWQTLNGSTYFFDKNGNYVTGEQVIQGAKYTFSSDGHLQAGSGTMGIDVSKWNGNIDWNAVRNSGVSYVIIRCGYRGSTTGALIEDPKFRSNIQGAKAAGLAVGAYFFTQATNEVEAVEEASMAIGLCSGYGLSLPIFLDVEHSGGRGDAIDAGTRTAVCKAFCNTVRNSGFGAGIYANKTWFTSYMNASQLTGYKIWLAQYAASPTYTATRYDYWQYTSKGSVAGISGNVDMNIRY